ncbi:MAG TPA: cytochrome C [Xanthobacteraceae bacterium]|jgi:cytochrome c553
MRTFIPVLLLAMLPAAALSTAALAVDRPDWAYPPAKADNVPPEPDDGKPLQAEGSKQFYTRKEINSQMDSPNWFPDEFPNMPPIVAHGNGTTVRACIGCHLPHGLGHPENSRLSGTTAAYLARQLADFKSGARKGEGAGIMVKFSKDMTPDQVRDATEYFGSLKAKPWTKVVETDTVAKSYFAGTRRLQHPDGGTEPIGNRIVELPADKEQVELRSPHATFVSYVPVGSLAKGEALVTTGGGGKTLPCAICHGAGLKGLGDVPSIAGRSPGNIARQIYYFQTGDRGGASAALMKGVVEKLTGDDVIAIAAYVASLQP